MRLSTGNRLVTASMGISLLAVGLLLSGCRDEVVTEKPVRPVLSQVVRFQPYWQESSYAGEVRARYETALSFRIDGKIVQRNVEVGQRVAAGDVLARLDPADYRLRLLEAEAELAAARAERNKASDDRERYATLLQKQVVSKAEYTDYDNVFAVAEARLRQAEAELEVTRNRTGYTALTTDREGIITSLEAEEGQVVSAGQTVARLARSGQKEAVISVPEHRLEELRTAEAINIRLWAVPNQIYRGKVREVSPRADPVTRTYRVRITVENAGPEVQLGMTAAADVSRRLHDKVAQLPLSAIFQQQGQPAVWVVEPSSMQVGLTPVEVLQYRQDGVLIRSGIDDGQRIVTAGVHKLVPGQRVRLPETGNTP